MKTAVVGKIASGKSTLMKELRDRNIPVFLVDDYVNEIYKKGEVGYERIKDFFGEEYVTDEGVDKTKLSKLVVADKVNLNILNGLIHPLINEKIKSFDDIVVEIPILKSKYISYVFDKIIWVDCSDEISINRLVNHRNFSENKARNYLMMWQEPDREKIDIYIDTTNGFQKTDIEKVVKLILDTDGR